MAFFWLTHAWSNWQQGGLLITSSTLAPGKMWARLFLELPTAPALLLFVLLHCNQRRSNFFNKTNLIIHDCQWDLRAVVQKIYGKRKKGLYKLFLTSHDLSRRPPFHVTGHVKVVGVLSTFLSWWLLPNLDGGQRVSFGSRTSQPSAPNFPLKSWGSHDLLILSS